MNDMSIKIEEIQLADSVKVGGCWATVVDSSDISMGWHRIAFRREALIGSFDARVGQVIKIRRFLNETET